MGIQPYNTTPNFPGHTAGNWYMPYPGLVPATGAALALDVMRFHPVFIPKTCTISDLGLKTTTAGANAQIAIYAMDPSTKKPTGAALASTPSIDVSGAAANKTGTLSASVQLRPGWYFFAVNSDNSSLVCAYTTSALMTALFGTSTLANVMTNAATAGLCYFLAQTYGTWPSVTGQTFGEHASGWALVFYKVSSSP